MSSEQIESGINPPPSRSEKAFELYRVVDVLRRLVSANFALSVVALAVYMAWAFNRGIDLDARWGITKHGKGPAWMVIGFMEFCALGLAVEKHLLEESFDWRSRLWFLYFAVFHLFFAIDMILQSVSVYDAILLVYLALSIIGYGLCSE